MSETHERKVKRILARDWDELRALWLEHVPNIEDPGEAPQLRLSELPELGLAFDRIPSGQIAEVSDPIPGLRSGLLHEGIYLLHKASHVLGATLVHVSQGMCTWSISSAYHASFFAMKSVMSLLGVTVIETDNNGHFLVDVWGSPQKRRKGIKGPIFILARTGRNEPRHLWAYFQRTLDETLNSESFCEAGLRTVLLQNDFTDFGRRRNWIHYRANVWGFDDLHQCAVRPDFGAPGNDPIDNSREDFSLRLAFGLVKAGHRMIDQIATNSVVLREESNLISAWLAEPFNNLYHQNINGHP